VALDITINSVGEGRCSLTQKEGEGFFVTFKDEQAGERFLTFKGFAQVVRFKLDSQPARAKGGAITS
jgi:hypothetical protein